MSLLEISWAGVGGTASGFSSLRHRALWVVLHTVLIAVESKPTCQVQRCLPLYFAYHEAILATLKAVSAFIYCRISSLFTEGLAEICIELCSPADIFTSMNLEIHKHDTVFPFIEVNFDFEIFS